MENPHNCMILHDVIELVNNSTLFQFIINKYSYKYYLEYLNLSERKKKLSFSPGKVSVRIEKAPRKKKLTCQLCFKGMCVCFSICSALK